MGDLIRRADALQAIEQYCTGCNSYNGVRCRACEYGNAIDAMENCEAVDAEPVRHGKCELCGRVKPIKAFSVLPEECGFQYGPSIIARYCPNCGARMDGGEEDG